MSGLGYLSLMTIRESLQLEHDWMRKIWILENNLIDALNGLLATSIMKWNGLPVLLAVRS
jgi:hypothetical protein